MNPIWRGRVTKNRKRYRVFQVGQTIEVRAKEGPVVGHTRYLAAGYNGAEVRAWLENLGYTVESLED